MDYIRKITEFTFSKAQHHLETARKIIKIADGVYWVIQDSKDLWAYLTRCRVDRTAEEDDELSECDVLAEEDLRGHAVPVETFTGEHARSEQVGVKEDGGEVDEAVTKLTNVDEEPAVTLMNRRLSSANEIDDQSYVWVLRPTT